MLPCHCEPKIYFRFFEVCTSIDNFVVEASPCNAISEGRPTLKKTSSEAGALPLEVRIENDSDRIFYQSIFVHSFLETNFLHIMLPCEPKICFRFFLNLHLLFDTQFWTRGSPLVMQSRKAGLPLATRALPLEVRIENDSDRIFSESKFVHNFL